jgi:hypothetical protein
MKFSTWNWANHPYDKTRGIAIGPFRGIICYIYVPTGRLDSPTRRRGTRVTFRRLTRRGKTR